jgi:hypothetical protein
LSIPVFRALIASDTAKVYHHNHAELAYALKDKAVPEWAEAEEQLSTAIEMRDRRGEHGYGEYEFNRAICRINLGRDPTEIVADFKRAAEDETVRTWSVKRWAKWFSDNGVTPEATGFTAA